MNYFCRYQHELSIYYYSYIFTLRPPLWSSGQSSWLQIQRSGFDSWRYHIFWEVVGLERGPLSIVSTIEKLLERKSSGFGLENRDYGRRDPPRWPRDTPLSTKVDTNFADKRRSLGCSSLADYSHGVIIIIIIIIFTLMQTCSIRVAVFLAPELVAKKTPALSTLQNNDDRYSPAGTHTSNVRDHDGQDSGALSSCPQGAAPL
jgi:hypothetical protein